MAILADSGVTMGGAPGDTLHGVAPNEINKIVAQFRKTNEVGQLKRRSSVCRRRWLKGPQVFFQEKIGVTPSVITPGDTNYQP